MRKLNHFLLLIFSGLLLISIAAVLQAESNYRYIYAPKGDIYFGHISFAEVKHDGKDPVVQREGDALPEVAVLNFPIVPGDTIRTTESRRCEIQFDTGTIIRLDLNTELKVETILAQSLSARKKLTNLILAKGQVYIMYKRYRAPEVFQVLTPKAALKMAHKSVAYIRHAEDGSTDLKILAGKADVLFGPDEASLEQRRVKASQNLSVSQDHRAEFGTYAPDEYFSRWNEEINSNFVELHEGKSFLPAPIQKYPKAVFYFAQKYSTLYGEWVWNSLFGYVWRPFYNDYYPWGSWQPYLYGNWREFDGQLFWVPEERWGWVPYHLGIWHWDKKLGWVWIPGSMFAPAWAVWDFFYGYYAWRPWSLGDWYFFDYPYRFSSMLPSGIQYGYFPGTGGFPWDGEEKPVLSKIRKDQLQKKQASPFPLPDKLKNAYKNLGKALKKGDEDLLASLSRASENVLLVKEENLNSSKIQEKIVRFIQFSPEKLESGSSVSLPPHLEPQEAAALTFRRNVISSALEQSPKSKNGEAQSTPSPGPQVKEPGSSVARGLPKAGEGKRAAAVTGFGQSQDRPGEILPKSSGMRIRDWNPDVRAARATGVSIAYSSRANEIQCPELGLTSKNVDFRRGQALEARFYSPGTGSFSSSSSQSSSSGSSGSSGASHSSGSGSQSSGGGSTVK